MDNLFDPVLTETALKIMTKQLYLWPKPDGTHETPKEAFYRVAKFVASAEREWHDGRGVDGEKLIELYTQKFYNAMARLEFLPNSPTIANAGKPKGQLAACFVLPIEDNIPDIYATLRGAAIVQTSGGGTGFSGARLRCRGSLVGSTGKVSGGFNSFLRLYNDSSKDVITQGAARKGANMWVLPAWHADVEDLITIKDKDGEISEFNISIGAVDDFMKAVERGEPWNLIDPKDGSVKKTLPARDLFDRITEHAWVSGDPGLVFLDAMNRDNPTPSIGQYEATNPCGEQPLLPYESCTLGHINLAKMVESVYTESQGSIRDVNVARIKELCWTAVRFLDNVVELNYYPLPEIAAMQRDGNRKIGVGVMGFADMLVKLNIPYGSQSARDLARAIGDVIENETSLATVALAEERGSFRNYDKASPEFKQRFPRGARNACQRTVAPTGTTGIMAGVGGTGVEPLFALVITRNQAGLQITEVTPVFDLWLRRRFIERQHREDVIAHVKATGTIKGAPHITPHDAAVWQTANEIHWRDHISMQGAWQVFIDSAVSKTINMPNSATVEDVRSAYMMAWKLACKGITIYRDGSKKGQVLTQATDNKAPGTAEIKTSEQLRWLVEVDNDPVAKQKLINLIAKWSDEDLAKANLQVIPPVEPDVLMPTKERSRVTTGTARKIPTGCGNAFVFVGSGNGGIEDVMGRLGKSGGCASAWWEALCRVVSLATRSGVDIEEIRKQLSGISCHLPVPYRNSPFRQPDQKPPTVTSCADALAKAIAEHIATLPENTKAEPKIVDLPLGESSPRFSMEPSKSVKHVGACPNCGGNSVDYGSGCLTCHGCGYSRC